MATFNDIQADVADIAKRLNANPELGRAALINPVLALNELGYELDLDATLELEDRARFSTKQIVERASLRKQVFAAAGRPFNLGDAGELSVVLYDELKLDEAIGKRPDPAPLPPPIRKVKAPADPDKPPKPAKIARTSAAKYKPGLTKRKAATLPEPGLVDLIAVPDSLEALRDTHEIVAPLLAYRQIDASSPRFAPATLWRAVRDGKRRLANVVPRAVVTGAG